jgi:hypothetical protein
MHVNIQGVQNYILRLNLPCLSDTKMYLNETGTAIFDAHWLISTYRRVLLQGTVKAP